MKKILWMTVLAAFLLMGTACAEGNITRESIIVLEGCEEVITETLYESPQRYKIWYPADLFTVAHEEGSDYFESIPGFIDAGVAIVNEQIPSEAVDEMLDAAIELAIANGGNVPVGVEQWKLESGTDVKYVDIVYGDDHNPIYYLYGNGRVFCVSCYYPSDAAEGIGTRIRQMLSTFEPID